MSYVKLVIVLIMLIGVGILLFMGYSGCKARKQVKQIVLAAINKEDTGKHHRGADSIDHFVKPIVIANNTTANVLYKKKFDSACKEIGVNQKQIVELQETVLELNGKAEAAVKHVIILDSSGKMGKGWEGNVFTYDDSAVHIDGYIEAAKKVDSACMQDCDYAEGKATIFYQVRVKVEVKKYWRRKHKILGVRFGRKIYFIDAASTNKNIEIKDLTDLQINN